MSTELYSDPTVSWWLDDLEPPTSASAQWSLSAEAATLKGFLYRTLLFYYWRAGPTPQGFRERFSESLKGSSAPPASVWTALEWISPEPSWRSSSLLSNLATTRNALLLLWIGRMVGSPVTLHEDQEDTEGLYLNVAARFSQYHEVLAVFINRYQEEIQITVAIDTPTYDRELIGRLLDEEYELRRQVPGKVLSFSYPPVGRAQLSQLLPREARLLYTR